MGSGEIQCLGGRQQCTLRGPLGLDQSALVKANADLHYATVLAPPQCVAGHGVEHLVADQAARECVGQCVQPFDAIQMAWRTLGQRLVLPCTQCARQLQDAVTLGKATQLVERGQEVGGKATAAGTNLDDDGPGGGQHLRHLSRQRLGKKRRELGRGKKVAAGRMTAELLCAAGVVAQAGLVECQLHVAGKRDPTAARDDLGGDDAGQRLARGTRVDRGLGQVGAVEFHPSRLGSPGTAATRAAMASPTSVPRWRRPTMMPARLAAGWF